MDALAAFPVKISRHRFLTWSIARRILLSLAVVVTMVAAFYTEENWRGKRAWEQCRHELEAQGAVFDWNTRIPPPVPNEQNFFSAPQMAEWFAGKGSNDLSQRLDNPKTHSISFRDTNEIRSKRDANEYLEWSNQFLPDLDEIRAALKRPYARIDCDYGQPTTVLAPNFMTIRNLVQTLAQRAHCLLLLGQPEDALQELTLIHDLCRVLECAPTGKPITLVGAMINVAVRGLYADCVAEGLQSHAWREADLRALEQQLSEIHLERSLAETLIDEPMFTLRTFESSSRVELANLFVGPSSSRAMKLLLKYGPRGWVYQYMVFHTRLNQRFSAGFEAANQTVLPREMDDAGRLLQHSMEHISPYNFLSTVAIPNWLRAMQRFAANQSMANEGAVACALERYHLKHGDYPQTLDALVPQFIDKVPHDLIGGQPLKYQRVDSTQFLLYSIGWNDIDDGGFPGNNVAEGDWVWGQSSQGIIR